MRFELKHSALGLLGYLIGAGTLLVGGAAYAQAPADDDVEINVGPAPAKPAPAASAPPASPTTPVVAPAPSVAPAPAPAASHSEIEALRAQLAAIEARLAASEARADDQEAAAHESAAKAEERAAALEKQQGILAKLAKLGVSISGYVQVQYGQNQLSEDQLQQGGAPYNQDRFSVRRGRLRVKGRWKYARADFELDASTTRGPTASVRRASVGVQLPSKVDGELPYLLLTAGLSEIPLGLELQQGQDEILFLERTTGSLALFPGPVDTGVKLEAAYGVLRAQVAVLNGAPLDDRAGGPSALDPTRAPDFVARLGADARPHQILRISGGVSFLTGTGFSPGTDATKPVLQWNDLDGDGSIGAGEIVSVAGEGAGPSSTFQRWAVGADLSFELKTKIGLTRLYGEMYIAQNLDRALYVADPEQNGIDFRELSWYGAVLQDVTQWSFVGLRYDVYDPNSDLFDARRGNAVPRNATISTISPVIGARWPGIGRFTFEYDVVRDKLARDHSGVPTDVANNQWTFRLQGEF
jgi:hypothetical protein